MTPTEHGSGRTVLGRSAARPRWLRPAAARAGGCTIYLARLRDLRDRHVGLLDPRELKRRSSFAVDADRDRFTLGAALLRIAAARSTGGEATAVTVSRTCEQCGRQHGRPQLPGSGLHASVSHSGDLVVVATTAAGPVGVDVELIEGPPSPGLPTSVCTPEEQGYVRTPRDFFTYWVRKEAVLKATGEGLNREMTDVEVTHPQRPPELLSMRGGPTPPCSMASITADGYTGAVAVLAARRVGFTFVDAAVSALTR
jgi:4'-phosphopantetheinyl transferase